MPHRTQPQNPLTLTEIREFIRMMREEALAKREESRGLFGVGKPDLAMRRLAAATAIEQWANRLEILLTIGSRRS
jgi:hypothetical protein